MVELTDPTVLLALVAGLAAVYFFFLKGSSSDDAAAPYTAGSPSDTSSDVPYRISQARKKSSNSFDQIQAVAAELKADGKEWKDPDFGHDGYPGNAIGNVELKDGERGKALNISAEGVTWQPPSTFTPTKRPLSLRFDGVPTWLYSDENADGEVSAAEAMSADDIKQGSIGDCYFLAAIAAVLPHNPTLADELIDETFEEQGIYGVSFWSGGTWVMVWVDHYFPCYRPGAKEHSGKHRLIFGGSTDRKEIWTMIVEKAYAKLNGNYEAIAGGQICSALGVLTGGSNGQFRAEVCNWQELEEKVKSIEYFVGAGSQQEGVLTEGVLNGIVTGHAYSVLNVVEHQGTRLLQLRNPWASREWKGAWADSSREWDSDEGRKLAELIVEGGSCAAHENGNMIKGEDGKFWMGWDDFCTCFSTIDWCHHAFSAEELARRKQLLAMLEEERKERAAGGGGKKKKKKKAKKISDDDGPSRTQASADKMMEMLLAEDAADKKKKKKGKGGKKDKKEADGKKKKSNKKVE